LDLALRTDREIFAMTASISSLIAAFMLLACGNVLAQSAPAARGLDCMIQPHQIVQVGSAAPGVIDRILVERGDLVTRGQPLVQLQAGVERAALAVARERALQQGEMTVA
jgi:multidrug efflux pump subunit AcrA (membrane-fusion protein)